MREAPTHRLLPRRPYREVKIVRTGIVLGTHWIKPHSSFSDTTLYVRMPGDTIKVSESYQVDDGLHYARSCLRRASESDLSSLFRMESKSISRPSFRRSSFLPRKVYVWPLLPLTDIFFGLAKEFMTSTSSKNARKNQLRGDMRVGPNKHPHKNVGASTGNGWCVFSDEDCGGRFAVRDSCKGMRMSCEVSSGLKSL